MKLYLNHNLGRFEAKLFALCRLNVWRMFVAVLFAEQIASALIENVIWGETFPHWFDAVLAVLWFAAFIYYANRLGEFLLKLHLEAEKID